MDVPNVKRQFPKVSELAPLLKFTGPTLHRPEQRLANAVTIWDLREIAKKRPPQGPYDSPAGAAESEVT